MRILILALLVLVSSSIKTHFVENDDEWIYIFDGETFNGWHQYNSDSVGSQWSIENGELRNIIPFSMQMARSIINYPIKFVRNQTQHLKIFLSNYF